MTEALIGMLGAAIGVGMFLLGFFTGKKLVTQSDVIPLKSEVTEDILQRRQDMLAEHDAFQRLVNYNTDVAYNTKPVKAVEDSA